MLTANDIDSGHEFHYGTCTRTIGPRGGETVKIENWRRNGTTKRWKRNAARFYLPLKYGLRSYTALTEHSDTEVWHCAEDCPLKG